MEIRITAKETDDLDEVSDFLQSKRMVSTAEQAGQASALEMEWSEPVHRSGLWETLVEWVGSLGVPSIPSGVIGSLIAAYLWDLITRGRGDSNDTGVRNMDAPLQKLPAVSMIIVDQGKQVEFDPLDISREKLESIVSSFYKNEATTSQ